MERSDAAEFGVRNHIKRNTGHDLTTIMLMKMHLELCKVLAEGAFAFRLVQLIFIKSVVCLQNLTQILS